MADLSDSQNKRLRLAMMSEIDEFPGQGRRFPNATALAKAIGRSQPSISEFLNGGGASIETAEVFATKVAGRPVSEIIGERRLPQGKPPGPTVIFVNLSDALEFLRDAFPAEYLSYVAATALGVTAELPKAEWVAKIQAGHPLWEHLKPVLLASAAELPEPESQQTPALWPGMAALRDAVVGDKKLFKYHAAVMGFCDLPCSEPAPPELTLRQLLDRLDAFIADHPKNDETHRRAWEHWKRLARDRYDQLREPHPATKRPSGTGRIIPKRDAGTKK